LEGYYSSTAHDAVDLGKIDQQLVVAKARVVATDGEVAGDAYAGSGLKPLMIREGTAWRASLPAVLGKTRRTE
jgi:hypothetical protein